MNHIIMRKILLILAMKLIRYFMESNIFDNAAQRYVVNIAVSKLFFIKQLKYYFLVMRIFQAFVTK